ncbi:putative disease resistance protein At1g50180 [Dioscorea cayenensis subsp. rotundata]|uniref:Disease resistance protein At1g50180 n=1 Tax=Dioscorea cayennensis subsp. rotundata TaxID=55577 RepID=A0AB40AZ86_DIOCR|nr:putative disease resistance protein At1g50180 [Dioscorea cayenensis subsp. rotundata]
MGESVASQVLHKLTELVVHEAIFMFGVRKKFEGMKAELEYIKCFLRDADAKKRKNETIKKWVHDIIDMSYQAEDAIDSFLLLVQQPTQFPCFLDCITSITPCQLMEWHRNGVDIDKIKERIKEIKSLTAEYGIQSLGDDAENVNTSLRRRHSPSEAENVDMRTPMLDRNSAIPASMLRVLLLTMPQLHPNHAVRGHFPLRIWIVVTHFSGPVELLAKLIQDVTVRRLFGFVMNRSRVLVTTRFKDIAMQEDPNPCELRFLNDDESVELLLKKAFPYQNVETNCPKELIDLAPQLAKNEVAYLLLYLFSAVISLSRRTLRSCDISDHVSQALGCRKNEAEKDGFLKIYTGRASSYTNVGRLTIYYSRDNTDVQIHDQS